ncbi:hypothetical protein RRG08_043529 [Elysia crispata]|uniref:Uncharacterized protein n=1 Tax=Elysia crispata TaxID=231223 RepID=A0AAE0YFB8_9GAST|nr:hypothetical protein RRG08_043529 [Elysia crispata]
MKGRREDTSGLASRREKTGDKKAGRLAGRHSSAIVDLLVTKMHVRWDQVRQRLVSLPVFTSGDPHAHFMFERRKPKSGEATLRAPGVYQSAIIAV